MLTLTINGERRIDDRPVETWGELLQALETGDGPDRPIVTAVRFDGVDAPSFRTTQATHRILEAVSDIDIELSTAQALIASSVQTALEGLSPLADSARHVGRAFRGRDLSVAHRQLGELIAALRALATLTAAVADASGIAGGQWTSDGGVAAVLESLRVSLEMLVAANQQQDWLAVADVLEYDIADALPGWATVLDALTPRVRVSAPVDARVA